jgi:hypothetical protein
MLLFPPPCMVSAGMCMSSARPRTYLCRNYCLNRECALKGQYIRGRGTPHASASHAHATWTCGRRGPPCIRCRPRLQ